MQGVVFDIKQFALYDGPGIRTTVFMKGCPLRCQWCHNPEGLSPRPELMVSTAACTGCGKCRQACPTPGECTACGRCIPYCPQGLRRVAGTCYQPEELAQKLLKDRPLLEASGGGITFSGGEPLMQWDFVSSTIHCLQGMHIAVETSGYTSDRVFEAAMNTVDLVMMDLKAMDDDVHRHYTGVSNQRILRHARMLAAGDTPFIIRLPMIPGVNDNRAHMAAVADLLKGSAKLIRVEALPYHVTAGAKYAMVSRAYRVDFDPMQEVHIDLSPLVEEGIPARVL